jgi:hypothetical protein
MRKLYSALLASVGMAACFTIGLPGAANAAPTGWPTGCSYGQYTNGYEASCARSNGGSYKATVTCRPEDGGALVVRDAGAWRTSGESRVFCPVNTYVTTGGIITRRTS